MKTKGNMKKQVNEIQSNASFNSQINIYTPNCWCGIIYALILYRIDITLISVCVFLTIMRGTEI